MDLALDMVDGGGALELTLEYNADLFCERSMRQMAGHYLARHPAILRLRACRRSQGSRVHGCIAQWLA